MISYKGIRVNFLLRHLRLSAAAVPLLASYQGSWYSAQNMKLLSWNVNGIRAAARKGAFSALAGEKPDVLCFQETRASPGQVPPLFPGLPFKHWNSARMPGYSGTATFSRVEPRSARIGIGSDGKDDEGRVLTLEFDRFLLVNVYTPNSRRDLSRLPFRILWDRAFLRFIKGLEKRKPVVLCGDINVAHEEIDLAHPKENRGVHGFTDEERAGFSRILGAGFLDTFRLFHPEGGNYTWWSLASGARSRNVGWRLDYFVISQALRPYIHEAFILRDIPGSDHCPVGIVLDL
jgi:exodeoxyribonuclease III